MDVQIGYFYMLLLFTPFSMTQDLQEDIFCNISCSAPDCYCPSSRIPDDIDPLRTPQLIIVSFNGPVTYKHREYIDKIFLRRRKNPNGTPIRMTLLVSNDDNATDYCSVNKLWTSAHEIASFSVSRQSASFWANADEEEWEEEIDGQRQILAAEGMVPETDVTGLRSPYLQPGGNAQYKFAVEKGYVWDSSIIIPSTYNNASEPKLWPYTMDYENNLGCLREPCPDGRFPGLWQIPVQPIFDLSNRPCLYFDKCPSPPRSSDQVYNILMKNFNQTFYNNRAPFMINFLDYKEWFDANGDWPIDGINKFIDDVLAYEDDEIYFVTYNDLVEWMKVPTDLTTIRYFAAFTRIQNDGMECEEKVDPRPYVNGVALVVVESVFFVLAYLYLYIKDNKD